MLSQQLNKSAHPSRLTVFTFGQKVSRNRLHSDTLLSRGCILYLYINIISNTSLPMIPRRIVAPLLPVFFIYIRPSTAPTFIPLRKIDRCEAQGRSRDSTYTESHDLFQAVPIDAKAIVMRSGDLTNNPDRTRCKHTGVAVEVRASFAIHVHTHTHVRYRRTELSLIRE